VIIICFGTEGRVNPNNESLVEVISSDWVNWKEIEIVVRDAEEEDAKAAADPVTGNFGVTWYQDDDADGGFSRRFAFEEITSVAGWMLC